MEKKEHLSKKDWLIQIHNFDGIATDQFLSNFNDFVPPDLREGTFQAILVLLDSGNSYTFRDIEIIFGLDVGTRLDPTEHLL
jgi:hypothetical protein